MPAVGETFAHYRIEGLLGQGGMGQVFLARDEKLRRLIALKVLLTPDESYAKLMVREARAAAAVEHPNKVTVFELGDVDGTPYIAMELIRGRTLRDVMSDGDGRWELLVQQLLDVARALDAAHVAGLVHRDVKPENVMIREDGIVKVLDFGIARQVAGDVDPAASTATATGGGIAGTAAYMPPEQVGGEELDGRCDQFAWGVVAFEVLAGEHPWGERTNALQLLSAMLRKPARSLAALRPDLPLALTDAISRTLAAQREARFATMRDVIATIAPLVDRSSKTSDRPRIGPEPVAAARSVSTPTSPLAHGGAAGPAPESSAPPARARWPWIALAAASIGALLVVLGSGRLAIGPVALRLGDRSDASRSAASPAPALPPPVDSATGAPSGADRSSSTRGPRVHRCHPNLLENMRRNKAIDVACDKDAYAWCDAEGQTIACCAQGLVAAGRDGICVCPPLASDESKAKGCTDDPAVVAQLPTKADAEASAEAVRQRVRACFRGAPAGRSYKLRFWVQISPHGEAAEVQIMRSDAPDPDMQACAVRELGALVGRVGEGGLSAYEIEWDVGGPDRAPAASASAR